MSGTNPLRVFRKKIAAMKQAVLKETSFATLEQLLRPALKLETAKPFTVFFSVCSGKETARIFRSTEASLNAAWKKGVKMAEKEIRRWDEDPLWVKIDLVTAAAPQPLSRVLEEYGASPRKQYTHGLAFDLEMRSALLCEELNIHGLLAEAARPGGSFGGAAAEPASGSAEGAAAGPAPGAASGAASGPDTGAGNAAASAPARQEGDGPEELSDFEALNAYLRRTRDISLKRIPASTIVFDCASWFCDEKNEIFALHTEGPSCGRREVPQVDSVLALKVILTSANYLRRQLGADGIPGRFRYGIYAALNQEIRGYNILRHAGSVWSLIQTYSVSNYKGLKKQIRQSIKYLLNYAIPASNGASYMLEEAAGEYKLGGNALAVIALTEFHDVMSSTEYDSQCIQLGKGILSMQNSDGSFVHVLHSETFRLKNLKRTVYYDGEAAFALCRLYEMTKDPVWLDAARKAADYMIREDYTKYRDHWVAYTMEMLTRFCPEEAYFTFALRNAQVSLERILHQPTTYFTYLELLMASFETYRRILSEQYPVEYLKEFDAQKLLAAIDSRVHFMLNGYMFPEYAMYHKNPEALLGAFFVRSDSFRIRIDDIQHSCAGFCMYFRNYDSLQAVRHQVCREDAGE